MADEFVDEQVEPVEEAPVEDAPVEEPFSPVVTTVDPEDVTADQVDLPVDPGVAEVQPEPDPVGVVLDSDFTIPVVAPDGSVSHESVSEVFVSVPGLDPDADYVDDDLRVKLSSTPVSVPPAVADDLSRAAGVEVSA